MLSHTDAKIHPFKVVPSLPEPLQPLLEIAQNLWWSWNHSAVQLFKRIDRELWAETHHNPIKLLGVCPQAKLDELAADPTYLAAVNRVHGELKAHIAKEGWFHSRYPNDESACIAYFCAEFALTESFQIYSGGLGVLAGDHVKSASELALPFIGVGLLYRNGYFQQYLNADGWQQEFTPDLDLGNMPVTRVRDDEGNWVRVTVDMPGRTVHVGVWQVPVGRVTLYLLDTNLPENQESDRAITRQLYGGNNETRIQQELVLGIGGVRALAAIGIEPTVFHMNEGHAAFLALERIRNTIDKHGVSFDEARYACSAANLFTTHTPVPAGIDRFPTPMIESYFEHYIQGLNLDMEGLFALGRENVFNKSEPFSMAVLALRTSDAANGVSKLHGEVSRTMWKHIWPGVPDKEVPIGHVTNGVHTRTWVSGDMIRLFDRYLGWNWQETPEDQSVWEGIENIPDEELWRSHESRRQKLISWVRDSVKTSLKRRQASRVEVREADNIFNRSALTIGFARRFATYKRGSLLLRDPQRLKAILTNPEHPVQILIAGKAHPADHPGKEIIRHIVHFARDNDLADHIVFLENYDMSVARNMLQGVDVWLNTPKRGMEASGTSGMKGIFNGVLNFSILDGWWDEAYEPEVGWAIGEGETYHDENYRDDVESQSIYDLLEKQIVPMFYERGSDGLPKRWTEWMKHSMVKLAPAFNTNRMVREYAENYYLPAHHRAGMMTENKLANAIKLAGQKVGLRKEWDNVAVKSIDADTSKPLGVHTPLELDVTVTLGDLSPDQVSVQVYYGMLDSSNNISDGDAMDLTHASKRGGTHHYKGKINLHNSGQYGYAVRIVPNLEMMATPFEPGLIVWGT